MRRRDVSRPSEEGIGPASARGRVRRSEGAGSYRSPIGYTSRDFRQELARVERNLFRLTVVSILVAAVAVFVIVGLLFQGFQ